MSPKELHVLRRATVFPLLVVAVVTFGLTGCSTKNPGTPEPGSGTSDSGASPTDTAPVVSDDWWKKVSSCGLLDQATATRLGYPSPGTIDQNNGAQNSCTWTAADGSVFGITLDSHSYSLLPENMGQLSDTTVAGRPAKQDSQVGGSDHACGLAVQATKGSEAYVEVDTLNGTAAQACTLAQNVGTAIAPNLPGGTK